MLDGANFYKSKLENCLLYNANLEKANLSKCNLKGAKISKIDFIPMGHSAEITTLMFS